jgi:hypothetical protein
MRLTVAGDQRASLGIGQILDALLRLEGELDERPHIVGVDEAVGVAAEAVHVAEAARNAALAHRDRHLMQCLGHQCPEVPITIGVA